LPGLTEKLGIKPRPYRTAFLVLLKSGKVINHLKNLATERQSTVP
jgi:hypothetical protein